MDSSVNPVAQAIDGATGDWSMSGDAMRWSPELAEQGSVDRRAARLDARGRAGRRARAGRGRGAAAGVRRADLARARWPPTSSARSASSPAGTRRTTSLSRGGRRASAQSWSRGATPSGASATARPACIAGWPVEPTPHRCGESHEQQLVDAGARAAVGGGRAGTGGGPRVPRRRAGRRHVHDARRHLAVRRRPGLLQEAGRARLARDDLAEGVRRARAVGDGALRRHRGAARRRRPGRGALDRRPAVGAEPADATAPRSSGRRSCRASPRGSASSSSG